MPRGVSLRRPLFQSEETNARSPYADNLYFWRFLALTSGALAPVLVPLAGLGRVPLLTPLLARRLRKLPIPRHRCSLRSRPFLSAENSMSTFASGIFPATRGHSLMSAQAHHANDYPPDFYHIFDTCCPSDFWKAESQVCVRELSDSPSGRPLYH